MHCVIEVQLLLVLRHCSGRQHLTYCRACRTATTVTVAVAAAAVAELHLMLEYSAQL
jgi:hypothetical protein